MKGWNVIVSWPTADGLPIKMAIHRLQVKCSSGKVRRSETDVLPLSYTTNLAVYPLTLVCIASRSVPCLSQCHSITHCGLLSPVSTTWKINNIKMIVLALFEWCSLESDRSHDEARYRLPDNYVTLKPITDADNRYLSIWMHKGRSFSLRWDHGSSGDERELPTKFPRRRCRRRPLITVHKFTVFDAHLFCPT